MSIKHVFVSGRGDNGDAGAIQPSQWNNDHELTGLLAALDALASSPNTVIAFDGAGAATLIATALFATLASPVFTGIPQAPTPDQTTNNYQLATTQFVKTAISNLVAGAGPSLDTLNELAAALGNDANFSTTVTTALANRLRVDAVQGLTGPQIAQALSNLGIAIGVSANNLVKLDGSAKLPAVDGSQLTNITPGSGAVRFDAAQTLTSAQADQAQKNMGLPAIMANYLSGLTLSTAGSSSSFAVAVGVAADSTNVDMMQLASSISKTTATWSAGTGNGALDTGTIAANTWYHAHLIKNVTSGVVDVLVSLSASAPTLPSGYTISRRIGSMKTDGSSHWIAFSQIGDEFLLATPVQDIATAPTLTTSASTETLASVPTGVQVRATGILDIQTGSGAAAIMISSLDTVDTAPVLNGIGFTIVAGATAGGGLFTVRTNTSGQFRARSSVNGTYLGLTTLGWFDTRGK